MRSVNHLWGGMLILGVILGIIGGHITEVSTAFVDSAGDAVTYAIGMAGVVAMWNGMMKLAEAEGLLKKLTSAMKGVLDFLFPEIPENHPAREYIAINFAANILGLGWASTPAGLSAMKELEKLSGSKDKKNRRASKAMCTFLVINVSSLQLIPMTVIAHRSQAGAAVPTEIVAPAILATLASTAAGVVFVKIAGRLYR